MLPDWAIFDCSWLQILHKKVAQIYCLFAGYFEKHHFLTKIAVAGLGQIFETVWATFH